MKWVAIDFGSSYSSASVMIDDEPVKVHPIGGLYNMYGFPMVAYVDEQQNIKVCNDALAWRCQNPERFLKDFKLSIHEGELRFLGVNYLSIVTEILKVIKASAQLELNGEIIDAAIITYPSSYSDVDPRLEVMRKASLNAGFSEVRFLKEAEAAAIYYDSLQTHQAGSLTLIYDLGGGTFDSALIEHKDSGYSLIGTSSGAVCGGQQFESAIYRNLSQKYPFKYDTNENLRFMQIDAITKTCKDIKESLSIHEVVSYPEPLFGKLVVELDRKTFNSIIQPLLEKTLQECNSLLHSVGKSWNDLSRIIMIGGSCAVPLVKETIQKYLVGQNASDVRVLHNKSDEDVTIESLFAVSLGALLSVYPIIHSYHDASQPKSFLDIANQYFKGEGVSRNWLKAAYYYNKEYETSASEQAFNQMMFIYQLFLDRLEFDEGMLIFQSIVPKIGDDSVDLMVEVLITLQLQYDKDGYEQFIQDIFDVDYWIPITKKVVESQNNL